MRIHTQPCTHIPDLLPHTPRNQKSNASALLPTFPLIIASMAMDEVSQTASIALCVCMYACHAAY